MRSAGKKVRGSGVEVWVAHLVGPRTQRLGVVWMVPEMKLLNSAHVSMSFQGTVASWEVEMADGMADEIAGLRDESHR